MDMDAAVLRCLISQSLCLHLYLCARLCVLLWKGEWSSFFPIVYALCPICLWRVCLKIPHKCAFPYLSLLMKCLCACSYNNQPKPEEVCSALAVLKMFVKSNSWVYKVKMMWLENCKNTYETTFKIIYILLNLVLVVSEIFWLWPKLNPNLSQCNSIINVIFGDIQK